MNFLVFTPLLSHPIRARVLLCLGGLLGLAVPAARPQAVPGASTPPQGQINLQLRVPLVVEDVVVLDRDNQPVHGLKAADFTVSEDGKPVKPQDLEEHRALPAAQPELAADADLGVNVFTNYTPTPANAPLNILLLDSLNTSLTDQAYVRQQMLSYLKTLPPGTRMAIFGLGSHLYLLQGFTSDPELLKMAIDSKRGAMRASNLLDNPGSDAPLNHPSNDLSKIMDNELIVDPTSLEILADMMQFEEDTQTYLTTQRIEYTLEAMRQLARYLSVLPGRKNVIWFSAGFPIVILPNADRQDPFSAAAEYSDDVRKTTDLLARSQVAIYPVDARGLFNNPVDSASEQGPDTNVPNPAARKRFATKSPTAGDTSSYTTTPGYPTAFAASNRDFQQEIAIEHLTMSRMAEDTGGKAFFNTNDLKQAVDSAVSFGSNYYSFTYTPPMRAWDGKYHEIEIRVNPSGKHLFYRKGYFADDPDAQAHGRKVLPVTAMQAAMIRGGPTPAEILFDVRVVPGDGTSDKLTVPSKPNKKLMKPPFRSYILDALLDIHGVKMALTGGGDYVGAIEFTAVVYNAKGELVNAATLIGRASLPAERYAQMLAHGLSIRQSIDVPVKGEYFLRVGVHDPASDRIGAVEIPVSALKSKQVMIDAAHLNASAKH